MFSKIIVLPLILLNFYAHASLPASITGESLINSKSVTINTKSFHEQGLVLIFMSAKCPCSDSHLSLIKKLSEKYKDFKFVAIHSNADEPLDITKKYFKAANFNFEVLQDLHTQIADQMQAFKTPHAFVLNSKGEILYQGGVTNSSNAKSADQFFLSEALEDISTHKPVRTPEGRTLGCVILRESEVR